MTGRTLAAEVLLDPAVLDMTHNRAETLRRGLQVLLDGITDDQLSQAGRVEITVKERKSEPECGDYKHIEDVDDAIIAVLGYDPWNGFSSSRGDGRTLHIYRAGAKAFYDQRPEDRHTAVLRKADKDLTKFGCFKPSVSWSRDEGRT